MFRLWLAARATLLLSACSFAGAVRVPDAETIGADLFVSAALNCDVPGVWRLFTSASFSASWLTRTSTKSLTPLMVAVQSGCSEIAALIMLHPSFDDKTIKKEKQRKALLEHVKSLGKATSPIVDWALMVVDRISISKVSRKELEWDMVQALNDGVWFLPKHGEWLPPVNLTELQTRITLQRKPMWNFSDYIVKGEAGMQILEIQEGAFAFVDALQHLWYLLLLYIQSDEGMIERRVARGHMRSIGWRLFFCCTTKSLTSHVLIMSRMAESVIDIPPDDDKVHEHMRARGDIREQYMNMSHILARVWNKTGNWVVLSQLP
mmetsp:Transcript_74166/g.214842  ORF Transcript_74166/g.214842 Transcript_74166/m.214842 type:complete len:320 (-) Transcript_74166:164-1123(-)